jgi:hypothetical protein
MRVSHPFEGEMGQRRQLQSGHVVHGGAVMSKKEFEGPSKGAQRSASILLAAVGVVALSFVCLMVYPFIQPHLSMPGSELSAGAEKELSAAAEIPGDDDDVGQDSIVSCKDSIVSCGASSALNLLPRSKGKKSKWEKGRRKDGGKHTRLPTEDEDDDDIEGARSSPRSRGRRSRRPVETAAWSDEESDDAMPRPRRGAR